VFHAPPLEGRQELLFLEFAKGQHMEIFTKGNGKADIPADAIGYQHFCLVVDDIHAAVKHLAAMNVLPHRPGAVKKSGKMLS
jgi:hypothetical protein